MMLRSSSWSFDWRDTTGRSPFVSDESDMVVVWVMVLTLKAFVRDI